MILSYSLTFLGHFTNAYIPVYLCVGDWSELTSHDPDQPFLPPVFGSISQKVDTSIAMWKHAKGYGRWGLMVGSVFASILDDVETERWTEEAKELRSVMDERIAIWQSLTFPFGSEMSWDNTGEMGCRFSSRIASCSVFSSVTYCTNFPNCNRITGSTSSH